ncbi:MAG: SBBP repeat-containing protein, partial [Caldisericia bacterium]|nr:SBBP repeat-containing protein [Caldisericia bacterium]
MTRKCFSLFLSICLIATLFVFSSFPVSAEESLTSNNDSPVTLEQANQVLQSSSNFFTENKGQWPEEVLFVGNTDFGKVAFTQEAVYYQLVKRFDKFALPSVIETQTIKLSFVNAQTPTIQGKTLLSHYNNYFIGNDPEHWGIHCNNYTQVNYTNVWDNIDLSYFFTPQGIKYEYYVHAGADIQDVQVQVAGADLLSNEQSLELRTLLGNLKDDHLFVYGQDSLSTLEASFQVQNDIFSFDVKNNLSTDETIVIDPLVYSTYLGGTNWDDGNSIAIDEGGNVYVTGSTYSTDFPMDQTIGGPSAPGYEKTYNGGLDAFVVKLNPSGTELLYVTYLGGTFEDYGNSIAVDEGGNAYVTGTTSSTDFPMDQTIGGPSAPGYDKTYNGGYGYDAFVVKLNPSGTELLYATYLGGTSHDSGNSIAVDEGGNAYVTGTTSNTDFPMDQTIGGPSAPGYDKTSNGNRDAFVVKLNPSGTELLYATYLGGTNSDYGNSIAIDESGNVYVTGSTYSNDFLMDQTIGGASAPGYDKTYNNDVDVFVVKLNPSGTELLYATYLGGSDYDYGIAIAVDEGGNTYVTGETRGSDFPMDQTIGGASAPGYDKTYNGGPDAFIVKLNSSGTELLYATYLGGTDVDRGRAIAIDEGGNTYVSGETRSSDFPMDQTIGGVSAPGYDKSYNNDVDVFVVMLNHSGTELLYATYLGGSVWDIGNSIAVDEVGNAYVTGTTYSTDFPMDQTIGGSSAPGYDKTSNGNRDAFVVKLDLPKPILDITAIANASSYTEGTQPILTITLANIGDEYAHSCEVLVTLPPQLQFLDDQLIASTPAPNNSRLFQAGGIPAGGSIAFPVFTEVIENVPADTTVTVSFDASCAEHATANTHLYIDLLHIDTTPPCPSLFLETTPNKPNYYYGDLVYLNVTLRNLGGQATDVKLDLDLPPALSYAGCDNYRAVGQGQHQTFTIGTMEPDSTLRFVIYAEVITDVKVVQSIPILLELTANECDSFARRLINIKLEPKRTGQQNLDLSVKLLNLEFDEETGKYYL